MIISVEELAENNGIDGRPAWVAVDGIVYDVSDLFLWKDGNHWAMHKAGCDLSGALKEAPHGEDLLQRAKAIGHLVV